MGQHQLRAITLWQPWASLVAVGTKQWETRTWRPKGRDVIAIHAGMGKAPTSWDLKGTELEDMIEALGGEPIESLPRGSIIATAKLASCIRAEQVPESQKRFGNFAVGRWAWLLDDVRPLPVIVRATGARGLWPVPSDILDMVCASLAGDA